MFRKTITHGSILYSQFSYILVSSLYFAKGLTFTAATHVVFAELYWDPGHIKQAEDRAHRIGQCNSVNIHYLIANGTLDTLMWGMLNRKVRLEFKPGYHLTVIHSLHQLREWVLVFSGKGYLSTLRYW